MGRVAKALLLPGLFGAMLGVARPAAADAPVEMTLEPWASFDGVDRPHRTIVTLRNAGSEPVEVVADRRLLAFEVRPTEGRRRRLRCRHPRAPRRARDRIRTLGPGESWREWVDLRMYCWGRALSALESGAEVTPRYGWRRATATRWVARIPESSRREWTGGIEPAAFLFPAFERPSETRVLGAEEASSSSPLRVSLSATSVSSANALRFRVAVRAREGRERVYVRPDGFSFQVRGPSNASCRLPGGGGQPPPDLFRRVSTRIAVRELLDASAFCPEDTFARAGIYEVTPKLRLSHSGEEWNLGAVTGRFAGAPSVIRVTSGEYVEQIPTPPSAESAPEP